MPRKKTFNEVKADFEKLCTHRLLKLKFLDADNRLAMDTNGKPFYTWWIKYSCPEGHCPEVTRSNSVKPTFSCSMCAGFSLSIDERIARLVEVHGDTYSYEQFRRTGYVKNKKKISIHCSVHGFFDQTYDAHISGSGCPKCAPNAPRFGKDLIEHIERTSKGLIVGTSIDPRRRYAAASDIDLKCKLFDWHPTFSRKASKIFSRGASCETCAQSQYVLRACKRIYENGYEYSLEDPLHHDDGLKQYVDIIVLCDEKMMPIEIDGEQHFDANSIYHNKNTVLYDRRKSERISEMGSDLLRIRYDSEIEAIIDNHFPPRGARRSIAPGEPRSFLPSGHGECLAVKIHEDCRQGLTNAAIAERYNVRRNYVSRILRGTRYSSLFMYLYPTGLNSHLRKTTFKWTKITEEQKNWIRTQSLSFEFINDMVVSFNEAFPSNRINRNWLSRYLQKCKISLKKSTDRRARRAKKSR